MRRLLTVLFTLLLSVSAAYPQQQASSAMTTPAEVRLDPNKPTVYLSFERYEGEEVWLRLRNNSRWAISIRAKEPFSFSQPSSMEDSLDAFDPLNRVVISPSYEIRNYPPERSVFHSGCTFAQSWIPSGRSVFFKIAREHLGGVATLRINFRYEWDGEGGEPAHYAHFSYHELLRGSQ